MTPAAAELAERLGLRFRDLELLSRALVHSSYTNERPETGEPNERLEFLGDAVISLVVSELLWERHPGEDEGSLTTRRAAVVSAPALAGIAERLDLGSYLRLGQGAQQAGESTRQSVLAGVFEAVTGAVYLEFGLAETRRWLLEVAAPELDPDRSVASLKAAKSVLQELSYARSGKAPRYEVVGQEGPDHDRRYQVEVVLDGRRVGLGEGRSRREAEKQAAEDALVQLGMGERK
ncbi:MAG TPA: ribonuclease III [Candidatus Limnocylindria bacterium]|nr:ribonuclease III [Candidatus Limnocylindria bacterium]